MLPAFQAEQAAREALTHLERRRPALIDAAGGDAGRLDAAVRDELGVALAPLRRRYDEAGLPARYFDALSAELAASIPARWREVASAFTAQERAELRLWQRGDVPARLAWTGVGLVVGAFILWAPFIPIWEKWLPTLMALGGWWMPDVLAWRSRRRYARALGEIVLACGSAQRLLDQSITTGDLLEGPPGASQR